MDLIPIEHNVSMKLKEEWELALLYEAAGMTRKATKLKRWFINTLCEENNIPIIKGHYTRECRIQNWQGFDWDVKALEETETNVPAHILEKMVKVREKDRLYIAFPKTRTVIDPVLLYMLPYHGWDCYYVELARVGLRFDSRRLHYFS